MPYSEAMISTANKHQLMLMDRDLREALKRVTEALRNAGVGEVWIRKKREGRQDHATEAVQRGELLSWS